MKQRDAKLIQAKARERFLTFEEVQNISGADYVAFRNWIYRDLLQIGERSRRFRRLMFSPIECMLATGMADLVKVGITPSRAGRIAHQAEVLFNEICERTAERRAQGIAESALKVPLDRYVVICVFLDDEVIMRPALDTDTGMIFSEDPVEQNQAQLLLDGTHLVFAAGQIVDLVMSELAPFFEEGAETV